MAIKGRNVDFGKGYIHTACSFSGRYSVGITEGVVIVTRVMGYISFTCPSWLSLVGREYIRRWWLAADWRGKWFPRNVLFRDSVRFPIGWGLHEITPVLVQEPDWEVRLQVMCLVHVMAPIRCMAVVAHKVFFNRGEGNLIVTSWFTRYGNPWEGGKKNPPQGLKVYLCEGISVI